MRKAEHRVWAYDVPITDLTSAGLPVASVVRPTKVATFDEQGFDIAGRLSAADQRSVMLFLPRLFSTEVAP